MAMLRPHTVFLSVAILRGNEFSWVDGNTIRLEGMRGGTTLHRVGENQFTQLGMDGKPSRVRWLPVLS